MTVIKKVENSNQYVFFCPGCKQGHTLNDTWQIDLKTNTINPSVKVSYVNGEMNKVCHSFIRNGQIQFLEDSWHELKGRTVSLPEFDNLGA